MTPQSLIVKNAIKACLTHKRNFFLETLACREKVIELLRFFIQSNIKIKLKLHLKCSLSRKCW